MMKQRYKKFFPKQNWITIRLDEELRLSDLKAHAGISNFTKTWQKDRQKRKGAANKSSHLVKFEIDKDNDYITFFFYSAPTYDLTGKIVNPDGSMEISKESPWYTQQIRILDFFKWAETTPGYKDAKELTAEDLKEILRVANVQVFCNCPSFHWQGDNWVISQFDASIYPTDISPNHWRNYHNDDNFVCKHLSMILSQIEFFIPLMASMIGKELKL